MERHARGTSLLEAVAGVTLLTALALVVVSVIQEVCTACQIQQLLLQAARQAAREIVFCHERGEKLDGMREQQDRYVFSKVIVPSALTHKSQFDNAFFEYRTTPPTVTVTAHYRSNSRTCLPPFPTVDPLKLGQIDITATATYALE